MIERLQLHVILHGGIVLLVGLLCGLPFGAVIRRSGDDAARAWRVAHAGGVASGTMLIAIAAIMPRLQLGDPLACSLAWSLIVSAYAFTAGVLAAALTGARGLTGGGTRANVVVYVAYVVGTIGSLLAIGLTIVGAAVALR
jgi:hypothetical protein